MSSAFGLSHIWSQGDAVTRAIMLLLLVMSVATWVVIALKSLDIVRHKRQARDIEQFWHSSDLQEGLSQLGSAARNPFAAVAVAGLEATEHHRQTSAQLHDRLDISDWLTRCLRNAIDDATQRLQSSLVVLASVGATAPFVGLLGTVWGIFHALVAIGSSGEASIDQVAGPIGETLIMTALGLVVAIPAVLGYNALVRGNKFVVTRLDRFAHDLHAYFVTGARVAGTAAPSAPGRAA